MISIDDLREAVDQACANSGRNHPTLVTNPCPGPDRSQPSDCCPACEVWHALKVEADGAPLPTADEVYGILTPCPCGIRHDDGWCVRGRVIYDDAR